MECVSTLLSQGVPVSMKECCRALNEYLDEVESGENSERYRSGALYSEIVVMLPKIVDAVGEEGRKALIPWLTHECKVFQQAAKILLSW